VAEAGEGDGFAFAELLEDVDDGAVEMIGGLRWGFAFAGQELDELLFCHLDTSGHTLASEKDPVHSLFLGADRVFCVSEATDRLIRPGFLRNPVFFELIGTKPVCARRP
jgi:hypothetical protein